MEWKLSKWYVFLWWILIGFILTIFSFIIIPTGGRLGIDSVFFWYLLISLTIFFTGVIYSVVCFVAWIVRKVKK